MAHSTHHTEINPRLTENTCDEPEASLMPLENYQHSPLLPLEAATENIKSLFRNLPRDVWIAKTVSKAPPDDLTSDESAAIHLYTLENKDRPLYSLLNQLLRDRDRRKLIPWFSYLHLFLTALFKLPTCSAKIVWRGVKADLHSKYHRGEHYTWWSFSSCTLSLEVLEQTMYLGTTGERTLFSIECLNGKNIRPHSYCQDEDEIILLPGFYFEVVSKVGGDNGLHIIHLREAIPPSVLLGPPFHIQHMPPIIPSIESILEKVYARNKNKDDMWKLFVVLPDSQFQWKSDSVFDNHYVLHAVCECSTNEIHFACYPAYAVPNPRVFFGIYGGYMKQFMIPLGEHLSNHQTLDQYHDSRFWSAFQRGLKKMTHVLDAVEHESTSMTKANNTSALKQLLIPKWINDNPLCRSMSDEMSVRWVCFNHYPADQLYLIRVLDNIENVTFDITQNSLSFDGEIDSAKISRICDIFAKGLRLYEINLSGLEASKPAVEQLGRTLSQASLIGIYYYHSVSGKLSNSEKSTIKTMLTLYSKILTSNPQVKRVTIDFEDKDAEIHHEIVDVLKLTEKLRSLNYQVPMVDKDFIQLISTLHKNQMLTTITLERQTLSKEGVQAIATLIRFSYTLTNLTLYETRLLNGGMQKIVNAICANPIMKELGVWSNELSDESVPSIIHLLHTCPSLTSLNVSFNAITVLGARWIFEELETNQTLLHFNISDNNLSVDHARLTIKHKDEIVIIGEVIGRMLLKNTTLCTLTVDNIEAPDHELRPIKDGLSKNRSLGHLGVGGVKYSSTGDKQITNILPWDCSLIGLDITNIILNEMALQKLSDILPINDTLRCLNLSSCGVDDAEVSILAKGLETTRVLSHIKLSWNALSSKGARTLGNVLRTNKTIAYLDIGYNKIGDDGAKAIADALSANRVLTYIRMCMNEISDIGGQAIVHALQSNNTLCHLDITYKNSLSSDTLTKLESIRRNLTVI